MRIEDLKLENLESKLSLLDGLRWLIKAYELDKIFIEMEYRADVESRVWIRLSFEYQRKHYGVSGQTVAIVKRRIYELLGRLELESGDGSVKF